MRWKLRLQGQYMLVTFMLAVTMTLMGAAAHLWLSKTQSEHLIQELSFQNQKTFKQELSKRADQISSYLAKALFNPLYTYNIEEAQILVEPVLQSSEILELTVFDIHGNVFYDGNEALTLLGSSFKSNKKIQPTLQYGATLHSFSNTTLTVVKPISAADQIIGGVYLKTSLARVNKDIEDMSQLILEIENKTTKRLHLGVAIAAAIMLLCSALLASIIARSWSRPLQKLTIQTDAIGRGNFNVAKDIAAEARNDEIGELSEAVRSMATKLEQRTKKITHLAYHDALTELPNRTRFIQHLQNTIKSYPATSFSVLFLDLDEFKVVNDNYGHSSGDFLLIRLAERLTDCANEITNDHPLTMISRIGGDEFLMLIPHLKALQDVDSVVKKIFSGIRSPILMENEELVVGGSIGVARYPYNGKTADELIKHADIAMYRAKADGKNTHKLFTPTMFKSVVKRANIERELRRSLTDLSQFELWFQPLIDLKTNRIIGAESLVRWRHPRLGLVPPGDFISIAEETAMILPLGQWLIEKLCHQLQQWSPYFDDGFHVSINISSKQLYRQNLVEIFSFYMEKFQVPTRCIRMEITESLLLQDEEEAEKQLKLIRNAGIQVWLDDFGTGYSSLSYLRRFTVDGIKIDRSFVRDITSDPKDQQLIQAMIAMANNLDLLVVAEGIETAEQAELVSSFGCDIGQGFYYDKPMPVDKFVSRLIDKQKPKNVVHIDSRM
ncbi:EAL domain-containing protein [Vibrio sp. ZSDZ34]|uniref:EAL domain-containing protein n=1 Tax=Vibrio gelatinilyticus TaxID=2893468 RepID=A0A9X1WAY9_9VIBR|nr:EAL domain-containing protein [Vibrio gelatinilyticus]MCJ2376761.1 EAL domain-containing protein [Vibrio gelatinilyticus]